MSTYYLSGPMTGLPDLNYPAFWAAATVLREQGHIVYNPADWEKYTHLGGQPFGLPSRKFDLRAAFRDYTAFIIDVADAVVVLPGWENSPGATAEAALARALGKPVFGYLDGMVVPLPAPVAPPCDNHTERQHRDMQPPWCPRCGWRRAIPAQPARKLGKSRAERDAAREAAQAAGDAARTGEVPC